MSFCNFSHFRLDRVFTLACQQQACLWYPRCYLCKDPHQPGMIFLRHLPADVDDQHRIVGKAKLPPHSIPIRLRLKIFLPDPGIDHLTSLISGPARPQGNYEACFADPNDIGGRLEKQELQESIPYAPYQAVSLTVRCAPEMRNPSRNSRNTSQKQQKSAKEVYMRMNYAVVAAQEQCHKSQWENPVQLQVMHLAAHCGDFIVEISAAPEQGNKFKSKLRPVQGTH